MNVEIGAEAALFPEKEYISGILVAVHEAQPCVEHRIRKRRVKSDPDACLSQAFFHQYFIAISSASFYRLT
jgi:hypothetical protein